MRYFEDYISEKLLCAIFVSVITTWSFLYILTQPIESKVEIVWPEESFGHICVSNECVKISAALKSSVDPSVDPCEDFYQFACGKWLQIHGDSSILDEAQLQLDNRIISFLSAQEPDAEDVIQKVRTLYTSCKGVGYDSPGFEVSERFLNELGLPTVPRVITLASGDGRVEWIKSEIQFQNMFGNGAFFIFEEIHYTNANNLRLTVKNVESSCVDSSNTVFYNDYENNIIDEDSISKRSYYDYYDHHIDYQTVDDLGISAIEDYLDSVDTISDNLVIDPILKRWEKIKETLIKETCNQGSEETYSIDNIEESLLAAGIEISDSWKQLILYISSPKFSKNQYVLMNLQQVNATLEVINNSDADVVEFFLWINIMKTINQQYKDISGSYYTCADEVKGIMGLPIIYGLQNEYLNREARAQMRMMIRNIREVYTDVLTIIYSYDESKLNYIIQQADDLGLYLGYPDWILDLNGLEEHYKKVNFSKEDFNGNILQLNFLVPNIEQDKNIFKDIYNPTWVNAFYDAQNQSIVFPMGVFSFPLYHLGLPSLNYGSVGTIMGHEIIHAMDDMMGLNEHSKLIRCIIKQYEKRYGDDAETEAILKEHENVADTGGVYLAFKAYQRYQNSTSLIEKKLVGYEEYTPEQMFFITYAYHWCDIDKVNSEESHSSGSYRIRSALKNSQEFTEAFNCPLGSAMNSGRIRCTLF